jgi:rare lipoprotein A
MKRVSIRAAGLLAAFWFASSQQAFAECGLAGAYAPRSQAQGESSKSTDITAVHRSLPVGTRVVVRNEQSGRSIIVRIVDRGLSALGQVIDLSANAMHALGMDAGAPVCVEVVTYGSESRGYRQLAMRDPLAKARSGQLRNLAKATSVRRVAYVAHHRKHVAEVRHGKGKRYAEASRGGHAARRSSHRRVAA